MRRAVALAAVAGFVDAVGFLTLNTLFTAHMSGNTAELGVRLGDGDLSAALPLISAVLLFVLGISAGLALRELARRRGLRAPAAPLLAVEVALLAALMGYGESAVHGHAVTGHGATFYLLAILAILAMGFQTAALQQVGGLPVRTTYVSGTLTRLAQGLVGTLLGPRERTPEARRRARLSASVWTLYVAGAVLGSYAHHQIALWSLAVPLAVIAGVLVVELTVRP